MNYSLSNGQESKRIAPLYCFAISAKRYALFNLDGAKTPIIRKASAHGLGHLLSPYNDKNAPLCIPKPAIELTKIGIELWQHDLWFLILKAALNERSAQVNIAELPDFENVAVSKYAATSPDLLRWFSNFNESLEYRQQVKPFNFLLAFHPKSEQGQLTPIAPYDTDHRKAASRCFDRNTGQAVSAKYLKTYRETLAQYHLHPEAKFDGSDYTDIGTLGRKHMKKDFKILSTVTIQDARQHSQRELARASGYSLRRQAANGNQDSEGRRAGNCRDTSKSKNDLPSNRTAKVCRPSPN